MRPLELPHGESHVAANHQQQASLVLTPGATRKPETETLQLRSEVLNNSLGCDNWYPWASS